MSDQLGDYLSSAAEGFGEGKNVPLYTDLLQPATKELGKALGTVASSVNLALSPLNGLVWGSQRISDWLGTRLTEKLLGLQPGQVCSPDISIAGPALLDIPRSQPSSKLTT